MSLAKDFDMMSEKVIDQNMCTSHCPCYVAEVGTPNDKTHLATARYYTVSEPYLNLRGRTWNSSTKGDTDYIPFTWTND